MAEQFDLPGQNEPPSARDAPWAAAHASSSTATRCSLFNRPSEYAHSSRIHGVSPPYERPPPASVFTPTIPSLVSGLPSDAACSAPLSTTIWTVYCVLISALAAHHGARPHSTVVASNAPEGFHPPSANNVSSPHWAVACSYEYAGAPPCTCSSSPNSKSRCVIRADPRANEARSRSRSRSQRALPRTGEFHTA